MIQSLIVIQILPALNNGGVERGTIEVANHLAELGHKSIVISAGGAMQKRLSDKVLHISLETGKKSLMTLLKIKTLRNIFIKEKADIVHARSRLPAWLTYKAIAKIKTNQPKFVTTIHGLYSVKKYSSIMARGDRVIAVSQTAADYVLKNYPEDLKSNPIIINRGIDAKDFIFGHKPNETWMKALIEKYPQLQGQQLVLLAGRLTALKGAKELIVWLKGSDNNSKLVLTANPDDDAYTKKLQQWYKQQGVANKVVWIGLQSQMPDLYALVDVVLNISVRPESFGRTVAESLAVGTPTVAYNHGGVGEILSAIFPDGKVELGNKIQLSATINTVLKTHPIVDNTQPYLLTDMLQKTENVYQELMHE